MRMCFKMSPVMLQQSEKDLSQSQQTPQLELFFSPS